MLVKYWKSFKWFLFIPLIVFVFVFRISNASALVYKNSEWYAVDTAIKSGSMSGISNGTNIVVSLEHSLENYDYIAYPLSRYNFTTTPVLVDSDLNYYCTNWDVSQYSYTCHTTSSSVLQNYNYVPVDYTISYVITTTSGAGSSCFLSSDYQGYVICPTTRLNGYAKQLEINISFNGPTSSSVLYYYLSFGGTVNYLNNDSTEITIQQNTTNTNLQYIYQQQQQQQTYMENSTTTGATTQVQGDFSDLATSFNSELEGVNDLSQLVLMPISLFMDLSTDNCQPLHLVVPFVNTSVDLPCMKAIFNTYFSGFYSIFTTIMSAVICYWVAVKTGALVKEIVDCDNDRIEVVDL